MKEEHLAAADHMLVLPIYSLILTEFSGKWNNTHILLQS